MNLSKIFRVAYLAIFMIAALQLASFSVCAQVNVNLHRPPPNQLHVADLWRVDLTNTTKAPLIVYLHGTAIESNKKVVVVDAQTTTFTLQPGTKMVNGNDLSPIKINTADPFYRNITTATGQVPSGDYTVCVEVVEAKSGAILGKDCYDQHIDLSGPPILILPPDESTVQEKLPNFSWLPPAPLPGGTKVRYQLKIVEVYGRQTAYDAMLSNPAYFLQPSLTTPYFPFPLSARPFVDGHIYAWKVTATNVGDRSPLGESEVWSFTFQPRDVGTGNNDGGSGSKSGLGSKTGGTNDGHLADSVEGYQLIFDYFKKNFYIPEHPNLRSGDVSPFLGDSPFFDMLADPNAREFVPNAPNDTASGGGCGHGPSVHLSFAYPPSPRSTSAPRVNQPIVSSDWKQPFGIYWDVRHSAPLDHIDLTIAFIGHETTPLAHYVYRAASGSIATATTFDQHSYILNTSAPGVIYAVSAVAIDVLGRTSGFEVQYCKLGASDLFTGFLPVSSFGAGDFLAYPMHTDSVVIRTFTRGSESFVSYSPSYIEVCGPSAGFPSGFRTVKLVNRDTRAHHLRSVYTPPFAGSGTLMIGGVAPIDFGELEPGESRTITTPASAQLCYTWVLYDMDDPQSAAIGESSAAMHIKVGNECGPRESPHRR